MASPAEDERRGTAVDLGRLFPATPPPGPSRPGFWRSPLRGPWLTAVIGLVLLVLITVVAVTGFLSHAAYNPSLPGNAIVDPARDLPLTFDWPAGPSWLYALTQGLHVNVGLFAIGVLVAKLWSVIPRLFVWPPLTTPAQAVERLVVGVLVASAIFLFATGTLNALYWYPFGFGFVEAHYYAAVLFVAALAAHLAVKLPLALRTVRGQGVAARLREDVLATVPEPGDRAGGLVAPAPAPATMSRRGLLAFAGAGGLAVVLANVGTTIGGPLRGLAFLSPRRETAEGPNGFPVNKTAIAAGVTADMTGPGYRLTVSGGTRSVTFTRDELLDLPQRTARLPIACVEGWSTTQEWTGVPLAELARRAGVPGRAGAFVESLQEGAILGSTSLSADQVAAHDALLALRVNGADLSMDHGYPARVIVPAVPGVHATKWVRRLTFSAADRV